MNAIQIIGAIEFGLVYAFVAIGVYITLRILDFPDLGVDGTFPLGAATCAVLLVNGINPIWAILSAVILGGLAGLVTSWLSTHLRFLNLFSGILVMTALYSINLKIMGRPNIPLLGEKTFFEVFCLPFKEISPQFWRSIPVLGLLLVILFLLNRFLKTDIGLALRATGNNARMARSQGINDKFMVGLGLVVSNGLVALGGALYAQLSGFADITLGVGTLILGLSAVIIGEAIMPIRSIKHAIIACVLGALINRFIIAAALNIGGAFLLASDLNLVTATLLGFAMLVPDIKKKLGKNT